MITIDVRGTSGVGKTHVALLIQQALQAHGIQSSFNDGESSEVTIRQINERVAQGHMPYGIKKRNIVITETNVRAES